MKVFITGAGGYVGTALTKELIAHGHTVLGLARSDASAEKLKSLGAEVHRGELENLDTLRAGALAADGVIHCAFDHSLLGTDYMAAARKDAEAIEAMGEALAGTNKPFINTSGSLLIAGKGTTEDIAGVAEGFAAGRTRSEELTLNLATKGVRATIIRLPPTVHGGPDLQPTSFIRTITAAASKHGFSAYAGDGTTRWPAVNVFDAVVLYRLVLESGVAGRRYHAVGDTGNRLIDIATAVGGHLKLPVKSIPQEEAIPTFGFIGMIMAPNHDNPMSAELTQEWTGWKPTHLSMLEELKAGNKYYY
jgi:nucleoside-diphosphate-sugar epimerase